MSAKVLEKIAGEQIKKEVASFKVGDSVKVHVKIKEGDKERVFPVHAPAVTKVEVERQGKVRRAKLYYLRKLTGKKTKVASQD